MNRDKIGPIIVGIIFISLVMGMNYYRDRNNSCDKRLSSFESKHDQLVDMEPGSNKELRSLISNGRDLIHYCGDELSDKDSLKEELDKIQSDMANGFKVHIQK